MSGHGPLDVVVIGSSTWDSPWLTEHHLARALAREHRVLYVDPPRSPLSPFRYGVDAGSLRALLTLVRSGVRAEGEVYVLRPLAFPPLMDPRARRASVGWLRRQVGAAVGRLAMRPDVVLMARGLPEGLPALPRDPIRVSLVKDWLQVGGHLTGLDADGLRRRELATWRRADLVCAISTRLQERLALDGIDSRLLRHGSVAGRPAVEPLPGQLADLPRPLLGCTGRIDGRWAFGALEALASEHPSGSVVLVGPVNPRFHDPAFASLLARDNVHHFPAVSNERLPAWLSAFDCCLIPYVDDEWQRYASPLKVWDYLAAGAPIAATGCPALGEFPPSLVHFALEPASLPALVRQGLGEAPQVSEERRAYAGRNTWEDRAAELMEMVAGAAPPSAAGR